MNIHRHVTRLILIAALFIGALGIAPTARAAAGCIIYVDTTGDGNISNAALTLREAIQIANYGTGQLGLGRPLSSDELANLQGCSWDSDRNLTTGGAGYADTIRFSNLMGLNPTITLFQEPIEMFDDSGDVLDGAYGNMYPTIDASAVDKGLPVNYNVTVKGMRVKGAHVANFYIIGTGNTLLNVAAWQADGVGISIIGDNNTIDGAIVGVAAANTAVCGADGNGEAGIKLSTLAGWPTRYNVIKNSTINCNGTAAGTYPGILITGSGADYNTIGPNNKIGTNNWDGGVDLPNSGNGVQIEGGADYTQILTTTIADNGGHGVSIANANQTDIGGAWIRYNGGDGINISGVTYDTTIGGPSFNNPLTGNVIGHNDGNGINLVGSNVRNTTVAGNEIGTLNSGKTDDGNNLVGVVFNGARTNYLGDPAAAHNFIGGNQISGVLLSNGASGNTMGHLTIGTQQAPNAFYGIQVDSGAHDNIIGTDKITVTYNTIGNVLIQGTTTATNTLKSLKALASSGFGLALRNGAFNNTIGEFGAASTNSFSNNQGQGLEISSGAHDNRVRNAWIVENGHNGIRLTGTGTTGNVISATVLWANTYDGLSEGNGATGNSWTSLDSQINGGLAVDKYADSETSNDLNPAAVKIQSSVLVSNIITITGTAMSSNLFTSVKVDAYEIGLGTSGHLNLSYIGGSSVNISGTWMITSTDRLLGTSCVAVIQTTTSTLLGVTTNSTEPSYTNCRVALPIIRQ